MNQKMSIIWSLSHYGLLHFLIIGLVPPTQPPTLKDKWGVAQRGMQEEVKGSETAALTVRPSKDKHSHFNFDHVIKIYF